MSQVVQAQLQSGTTQLTCWLEARKSVKPGNWLTLRNTDDVTQVWTILAVSEPRDRSEIHRGWNNNI